VARLLQGKRVTMMEKLRDNAMNAGVLKYLSRGDRAQHAVIAPHDSVAAAYVSQGSHPDIVQRVWDDLGGALPVKCQFLVYGTPALVHERSGIVLAICNGTQYNIRLTVQGFLEAITRGATTRTRWSSGQEMDSLAVLGPGWVFGGWFKEEEQWCRNTYQEVGWTAGPATPLRQKHD
jgi:hypothetical protein